MFHPTCFLCEWGAVLEVAAFVGATLKIATPSVGSQLD